MEDKEYWRMELGVWNQVLELWSLGSELTTSNIKSRSVSRIDLKNHFHQSFNQKKNIQNLMEFHWVFFYKLIPSVESCHFNLTSGKRRTQPWKITAQKEILCLHRQVNFSRQFSLQRCHSIVIFFTLRVSLHWSFDS